MLKLLSCSGECRRFEPFWGWLEAPIAQRIECLLPITTHVLLHLTVLGASTSQGESIYESSPRLRQQVGEKLSIGLSMCLPDLLAIRASSWAEDIALSRVLQPSWLERLMVECWLSSLSLMRRWSNMSVESPAATPPCRWWKRGRVLCFSVLKRMGSNLEIRLKWSTLVYSSVVKRWNCTCNSFIMCLKYL